MRILLFVASFLLAGFGIFGLGRSYERQHFTEATIAWWQKHPGEQPWQFIVCKAHDAEGNEVTQP